MCNQFACLNRLPAGPGGLMRGMLLIQAQEGCISHAAVHALSLHFQCSEAEVESLLNFYPQFKRICPGRIRISVCKGTVCREKHSPQLLRWIFQLTGLNPGETDGEKLFSVEEVDCLGSCSLAPAVCINGKVFGKLDKSRLSRILDQYKREI